VTARLTADGWQEALVAAFRAVAGRPARWVVVSPHGRRVYEGRVPPVRRWRAPDAPCLVLAPGTTDDVHVLATMELSLRCQDGQFFLARRKWYEADDLDLTRLGPGPVEVTLETLE
jgi:hypothetical protein